MADTLQLSIVMPALNEEKNVGAAIQNCIDALSLFQIHGEVIVVNDGSSDGTGNIIQKFMDAHPGKVRTVIHPQRKGIGASFWDGVDSGLGNIVVMIPGDNENDPREILRYLPLLNHVDLVIPFVFNKQVRSLFRNFLSYVYRFIINTTFLVHFNYTNGTVLYRRKVLKTVRSRSTGFFFQTDLLIRLVKQGYLFAEVPYKLSIRSDGKSKATTFPSLLQTMKGYLTLVKDLFFSEERIQRQPLCEDSLSIQRQMPKEDSSLQHS